MDCIIVGAESREFSAALTLKANGKNFMLLGSPDLSVKISRAECIRNYPGLSSVTGREFTAGVEKTTCRSGNFCHGRTGFGRLCHGREICRPDAERGFFRIQDP